MLQFVGSFVFLICITRPTLRYWYSLCGLCCVQVFIMLVVLRFMYSFWYSLCVFGILNVCFVTMLTTFCLKCFVMCPANYVSGLHCVDWCLSCIKYVMYSEFQVFIMRTALYS